MLHVSHLTKTFKTRAGNVTAVNGLTFDVTDGTLAAIIGKSGSGKSTLLSLLGTLDAPTSGSIEVNGQDISKIRGRALTRYRRRSIGFIFQQFNLIPNLSARENVMLPMEFAGVSRRKRLDRAIALLEQVGIGPDKQHRRPNRLSGGEQQRVAIARALANEPSLILADEPTGNLDSATGQRIVALLHDLTRGRKTTVVVVTHDLGIARQCEQVLEIADGKIVAP